MKRNKVKIDLRDLALFNSTKWYLVGRKNNNYWKDNKLRKLHRLIMKAASHEFVDHINGDRNDNRRRNLRITTRSGNNQNAGKRKDGRSKWKGVYPIKNTTDKVWAAHIRVNKKRTFLGAFSNQEDAATVYNFAAAELHGEFARFNVVPQPWLEGSNEAK